MYISVILFQSIPEFYVNKKTMVAYNYLIIIIIKLISGT